MFIKFCKHLVVRMQTSQIETDKADLVWFGFLDHVANVKLDKRKTMPFLVALATLYLPFVTATLKSWKKE